MGGTGIGFSAADLDKDVSVLSGGECSRLALATLMTQPADLLVLDEPTNHLDLQGIAFLEDYVQRYPGAVVVIGETMDLYPEWRQAASSATLNTPTVTGLTSDWGVILVSRKTRLDLNWEKNKDEIIQRLRPYAAEYALVKSLREDATIEIDSLLFKKIMILSGRAPSTH